VGSADKRLQDAAAEGHRSLYRPAADQVEEAFRPPENQMGPET
jgi:hypothetical protein